MAIRVFSMADLAALAPLVTSPSQGGGYANLQDFLAQAAVAQNKQPPYVRPVEVHWNNPAHFGQPQVFQGRVFRVTYSGNLRQMGGFSSEAYISLGNSSYAPLIQLHRLPVLVDYAPGALLDVVTVL